MNTLQIGEWVRYIGDGFPEHTGKIYQIGELDWIGAGYVGLRFGEEKPTVLDAGTPYETTWNRSNNFAARIDEIERVRKPDEGSI